MSVTPTVGLRVWYVSRDYLAERVASSVITAIRPGGSYVEVEPPMSGAASSFVAFVPCLYPSEAEAWETLAAERRSEAEQLTEAAERAERMAQAARSRSRGKE